MTILPHDNHLPPDDCYFYHLMTILPLDHQMTVWPLNTLIDQPMVILPPNHHFTIQGFIASAHYHPMTALPPYDHLSAPF